MSRNPLTDPRFGDVFRATASPTTRDERIMYLAPVQDRGTWIGLRLDQLSSSDPNVYVSLSERYVGWKIVDRAEVIVEMTCDHPHHRGSRVTLDSADNLFRGCAHVRVA